MDENTKHLALVVRPGDSLTVDGALIRITNGTRTRLDIYAPPSVAVHLERASGRSRDL